MFRIAHVSDPHVLPHWRRVLFNKRLTGYANLFLRRGRVHSGPAQVTYTEFKTQVAQRNVAELFSKGDSIQGRLKKPAPLQDLPEITYHQFTTERPTFARDDLLTDPAAQGAVVRAKPLIDQRGFLANLVLSVAPILVMIAFYAWMFRR
jgi:cell division protease FtsH